MSFILPSKYIEASMEPPKPLDPRIKLEKVPGHIALVHTFSGFSSAEKARPLVAECIAKAREALPSESFIIDEATKEPKWEFLGYNPPFTLPARSVIRLTIGSFFFFFSARAQTVAGKLPHTLKIWNQKCWG
mmetsp:Transcript_6953/g.7874  ORF Transcript_6953/g.7874 Transcript_6953/m.7874 type:complete len:132 (-) Transcript_6953:486-881(-)